MSETTPTYWDYLRLPQLLNLQQGLDATEDNITPDEMHFIVIHQVYELWFKLTLMELRMARDHLSRPLVPEETIPNVVHHLRRVCEILRTCVSQFSIMETLTPLDFLDFRDKLAPSSGFQSFQMRELEILLGLEEAQRESYGKTRPLEHIETLAKASPGGAQAWGRIEGARAELSLRQAVHDWLYRTPIQGSTPSDPNDDEVVDAFLRSYLDEGAQVREQQLKRLIQVGAASEPALRARFAATESGARSFLLGEDVPEAQRPRFRRLRAALLFIESYRELPLLAWPRLLVDTVVELEEQMVLFRHRHARMVERLIGRRVGTGGSSGVEYLDKTTHYRVFPELWAVRSLLNPRRALPELQNRERYGFSQA